MPEPVPSYPPGTARALIESDLVTLPTRRALRSRLRQKPVVEPRFFDNDAFATLKAVCARLIPQPERDRPIDLAGGLDARLMNGDSDGWRFAHMPPDRDMHVAGLTGIDQASRSQFGAGFVDLTVVRQDDVLRAVQEGKATGASWETLDAGCYFEELLAVLTDIYYAHPFALEEIGYVGMADAHGWQAIGLDEREAHEPMPLPLRKGAA